MTLANDVARCPGQNASVCQTCARRLQPITERVIWMTPPFLYRGVCSHKIKDQEIEIKEYL